MPQKLKGKVAVITGGNSGIGLATAKLFQTEGATVIITGRRKEAVLAATTDIGGNSIGIVSDSGNLNAIQALYQNVKEKVGKIDILFLNAGVATSGPLHEQTLSDWQWILGVNLMGIVHGLDAFLPGLVAQDEGHVVITASVAGLTAYPNLGPYSASKHAAVAIAETLHNELSTSGSKVGTTALCPGFVATGIFESERNRPEYLTDALAEPESDEDRDRRIAFLEMIASEARRPDEVADLVHDAILNRTFWVCLLYTSPSPRD